MQPVKNQKSPEGSEISVEITDAGIKRVVIFADNADQQARAHRLLAGIAAQMCQLDRALKAGAK